MTKQQIEQMYPAADPNILNSENQWVTDTNWDWQALNVVPNSKNGKGEMIDSQGSHLQNEPAQLGAGQTLISHLGKVTRYFKLETRENVTQRALTNFDWGYKWDNYQSFWGPNENPPAPKQSCAANFKGIGKFYDIQGITGLEAFN